MKKRSLWILIMSALLCLSIMLAACSNAESVDTNETGMGTESNTEIETEKDVPADEIVDYSAILGEWSKYLSSVGQEKDAVYTSATHLFKESDNDTMTLTVSVVNNIASVNKLKKATYNDEGELLTPTHLSTEFYNLKTGEKILALSQKDYDSLLMQYSSIYTAQMLGGAIIEVANSKWTNGGTEESPDWKYVTVYSYYDNTGNIIAENIDDKAVTVIDLGIYAVKIANKAYHLRDGEIILVTDANDVYAIPDFDIEYNGYMYSFDAEELYKIQVLNESYELVADYAIPSYLDDYDIRILENGDVYIYCVNECSDSSEDYDYVEDEEKYKVWHIILSVTTGETTIVDAPFIFSKNSGVGGMATNYDAESTGISLKGEYQYAEIVRIEDGKLGNDVEFVILDNKLEEVATLPAILKNQTSLYKGLGNGQFFVSVDNAHGYPATFVADANSGEITRYINGDTVSYIEIDGGFIVDGKLYNNSLEMLYDLNDTNGYSVYADAIYFTVTETVEDTGLENESSSETEESVESQEDEESSETEDESNEPIDVIAAYVGYIDDKGEFQQVGIGDDAEVEYIGYHLYKVKTDSEMYICNRLGARVSLSDASTVTSINVVASCEEGIVVKVTHSDDENEVVINYYIIK